MAVSNPYAPGPFPAGSSALVTAQSHAARIQRVTITGPPATVGGANAVCTLQGSGEGKDMTVPNSNPTSTRCTFEPATTTDPLPLSLLFQFSRVGSGTFTNTPKTSATTNTFANIVQISATTEDSTDDDNNDSVVTITVEQPPTSVASPQLVTSKLGRSDLVESGLLFNPTDRITLSVGPFSGNSTLSDFKASTEDWKTVTGEVIDIHQNAPFTNILLMRFLFTNSTTDETQNASLLLNGVLTYVGSMFIFRLLKLMKSSLADWSSSYWHPDVSSLDLQDNSEPLRLICQFIVLGYC